MNSVRLGQSPGHLSRITLTRLVEKTLHEHRSRYVVIDQALFREPAWDILLELFLGTLKGQRLSVSNACIATNIPESTALRHLRSMEERGYISRTRDEGDRRRIYVELTRDSIERLTQFFHDMAQRWGLEIIDE